MILLRTNRIIKPHKTERLQRKTIHTKQYTVIMSKIRKIIAFLLLGVFVTITIFTDFHRHSVIIPTDSCKLCTHNLPHPNHISQGYTYQDICLLCQFSSEEFDISKLIVNFAVSSVLQTLTERNISFFPTQTIINRFGRAPPYVLD
ncbi:MAG: hypothetical protein IJ213_04255 [Bacteroidales bacterium]|nr:hypothetical protein [Bacteroidales bacterium]